MLLLPGIYKVIGNKGCNSYVIETGAGLVIVDVGFLRSEMAIKEYIETQLDVDMDDVAYIVITHAHRDVVEGLPDLLLYCPNAEVLIHKDDLDLVRRIAMLGEEVDIRVVKGDEVIEDSKIEIFSTPGHTPGSIVVRYEKALFSGGVVYVSSKGFSIPRQNYDRNRLLDSLGKIAQMSFDSLFPAHGRYILKDADRRFREFYASIKKG